MEKLMDAQNRYIDTMFAKERAMWELWKISQNRQRKRAYKTKRFIGSAPK